jgi:hypothetical protein
VRPALGRGSDMTSTERQLIARRNQAAARRRLARSGVVEQPRLAREPEAACPDCRATSAHTGNVMPDHGETLYECPRCLVTFYTMGPSRLASR